VKKVRKIFDEVWLTG